MKKYLALKYLAAVTLIAFACTGLVEAHTHLHKSEPANNSTVTTAPKNLSLEFNEPVQLTALTLQKGDAKAEDLKPLPKQAAKQVSVPMPALAAGSYIVKWRAVSDDTHVMTGKLLFTVK